MSEEKARRRGRPRLPAEQGKRHPIAIRTTKELKERLERASAASGRSLAQEMEFRLERSFEVQDVADVVYPLIARISDQIGELGLFIISHNDPDHLNGLMELLEVDGLRARIESTRPPVDGMAKVPGADELRARLARTPDSGAGLKRTCRSQRDRSQESAARELVDSLKRARDEAAHQFGHLHEKDRCSGSGER
jgi:hypothetical protein